MKRIVMMVAALTSISWSAHSEDREVRPDRTVMVQGGTDLDGCPSTGTVMGLDPHGDGFLAVKSFPSIQASRIDKVYNGQNLSICEQQGDWYAVVYSKRRQECNVNTPWAKTMPYTGPCASGWVHKRWIGNLAG